MIIIGFEDSFNLCRYYCYLPNKGQHGGLMTLETWYQSDSNRDIVSNVTVTTEQKLQLNEYIRCFIN